jgi:hypothetical protein
MGDDFGDFHGNFSVNLGVGSGAIDHRPDRPDAPHDTGRKTLFPLLDRHDRQPGTDPRHTVNAW